MLGKRKTLTLWAVLGLALPLRLDAQHLQGAASALQQLNAQKPPAPQPRGGGAGAELRHDLVVFREKAPSLSPQEAAHQWLALAERYPDLWKAPRFGSSFQTDLNDLLEVHQDRLPFQEALEVLPPPSAWNALAAEIQAHPSQGTKFTPFDQGLLLLSHVLQNDVQAQLRDMEALKKQIPADAKYDHEDLEKTLVWLTKQLMSQSTDPQQIQEGVELQMAFPEIGSRWDGLRLPDLVTLLGPQKAEALLRQALLTTHSQIEIPAGEATRSLTQKLTLELVDQIKVPQWQLANALDATELYEALAKRFPVHSGMSNDPDEELARLYYLVGLVVKGRTEEAAALTSSVTRNMQFDYREVGEALYRSGHAGPFVAFLQAQLTQNINLPLWQIYISTAARTGQIEPMLKVARAAAAHNDLAPEQRAALQMSLYQVLLASDRVDEGVAVIYRILADPPAPYHDVTSSRYDTAIQLIRIGYSLKREDWIRTGIAFVKNVIRTGEDTTTYSERAFGRLLREMGRYPEAEQTLIAALVHEVKSDYNRRSGGPGGVYEGRDPLVSLAQFYCHAGRYADVMYLIDHAPNWSMKDLVDAGDVGETRMYDMPMQYVAAVALAQTGRRTEAITLLQRLLLREGGFDPAYERLLALQGQKAMPFLETLFRRNRFEERPLIWKAVLLQRAGHLAEAEKTARAAIALDPSDGEEGHGDRMRAYSVLADIREARGDHAQAKQYREVVQAIRISEHADDLKEAGLIPRAIALYQQALKHFTNAYCIQSRLAVQMQQQGRLQEAAEHYRLAFELMPSSFGPMEGHCFGCEGVFRGETAESTAERVFLTMLKKTPKKPQLHYLMGYLREQQGRDAEALDSYREAVALDPDYVNAWCQIQRVGHRIALPPELQNAVAVNRMRLQGDVRFLKEATDLRAVWTAVQTAQAANPAQRWGTIYPFAASKFALEMLESIPVGSRGAGSTFFVRHEGMDGNYWSDSRQSTLIIPSPNQVIAHQEVVSLVLRLIDDQLWIMENQRISPPQ